MNPIPLEPWEKFIERVDNLLRLPTYTTWLERTHALYLVIELLLYRCKDELEAMRGFLEAATLPPEEVQSQFSEWKVQHPKGGDATEMRYQRTRFPNGTLRPMSADNRLRMKEQKAQIPGAITEAPLFPPPLVQAIRAMKNAILWLIGSVVFLGLLVFLLWYSR